MQADWGAIRREFPALAGWTFLNTATFGQMPVRAHRAIREHLERRDRLACSDFIEWFDDADGIRGQIAQLICCSPADIAFITNASTALSLLIGGMDWRAGDRIITLKDEFPNHYYYASCLAARGVEFVEAAFEDFYGAITPQTRLVALSTVNYSTGFRPPLTEISRFLRERGVRLYVDGTQSLGALRFDVRAVQPDLLAVDAYKWLLGPTGAGFMYVSPELRERLAPAVIGWRSHYDWRNQDRLHHGLPQFKTEAEKYEGGMLPFPALYAMAASVGMMLEIGPANIEARVTELASEARRVLRAAGARILHEDSPIIAAQFEGVDASQLARDLKRRRVLVAARHGSLRVSTHFYNNQDDIAAFAAQLAVACTPA